MPRLNQHGVAHILLILILLIGIIGGVYLVTNGNPLKLFSKASNPPIVFKSLSGQTLDTNSEGIPQSYSASVKAELTSTLGSPASPTPVPSPATYTWKGTNLSATTICSNPDITKFNVSSSGDVAVQTNGNGIWTTLTGDGKTIVTSYQDGNSTHIATNYTNGEVGSIRGEGSSVLRTSGPAGTQGYKFTAYSAPANNGIPNLIGALVLGEVDFATDCNRALFSPPPTSTPVPASTPPAKRVFITSRTYGGVLGGLSGADQKCQERAETANLGGTWKAWLSDSQVSASSRLSHFNGRYKLLDGTTIAENWNDLVSVGIYNRELLSPINVTEQGNRLSAGRAVWTNTNNIGDITNTDSVTGSCNDWQIVHLNGRGKIGDSSKTNFEWTNAINESSGTCDERFYLASLYCFEQGNSSTPTPVPTNAPTIVPTPASAFTTYYRYSEDLASLDSELYIPYTTEPVVMDYTFRNPAPGPKFFWVDFKDSTGRTERKSAQINIVPSPTPVPQTGGPVQDPVPDPTSTPAPVSTSAPTPKPVVTRCSAGTVREECIGYSSNNINTYCWGANNSYLGGKCSSSCAEADKCGVVTTTPSPQDCGAGERKECIGYIGNRANAYCWKGSEYIKSICSSTCSPYSAGCE